MDNYAHGKCTRIFLGIVLQDDQCGLTARKITIEQLREKIAPVCEQCTAALTAYLMTGEAPDASK